MRPCGSESNGISLNDGETMFCVKGHKYHNCPITHKTEYNNYCWGKLDDCINNTLNKLVCPCGTDINENASVPYDGGSQLCKKRSCIS